MCTIKGTIPFSAFWIFKNVFVQLFSTYIHLPFVNLRKKKINKKNQPLCLIKNCGLKVLSNLLSNFKSLCLRAMVRLLFRDRDFTTVDFRGRVDRKLFGIDVFENGVVRIIK